MIGALVVIALARWWPQFSLSTVYRVFLPAVAAVFIVLSSFPVSSPYFSLGLLISHGALAVIAFLALASLCAVGCAGEFSPLVVGAALAAVCALEVLLGPNLRALFPEGDTLGAVLLVCATCYFVYVLVSPLADYYRLLHESESDEDGLEDDSMEGARHPASPSAPRTPFDYEGVCACIADKKGLSSREREILPYVARGHRPAYVADLLCISEHTVRTHIRNTYRKLGVGSREGLIHVVQQTVQVVEWALWNSQFEGGERIC